MLTGQKIAKLREAINLLHTVDQLQQTALGDCDVAYDTHNAIQNIIDNLADDIEDLAAREAAGEAAL